MKRKVYNKKKYNTGIIFVILGIILFLFVTVFNTIDIHKIVSETESNIIAEINEVKTEKANVIRVVDGDTLLVKRNGNEERVRLIGVDTPESVNPDESKNTEEGKIASDFTKSIIKEGQAIYLEFDEETTDKYGRILAYVWLTQPTYNSNITKDMLNGILLFEGYAETMKIEPNTKYAKKFDLISK